MEIVVSVLIISATVLGMEYTAWFTHKYIMHGFLWSWHEIHHKPHLKKTFLEKNDLFFLVFAVPSTCFYIFGSIYPSISFLFEMGIGISIYGMLYFLIHDVYIHNRFPWFKQSHNIYSKAIIKAHGAHHANQEREGNVSFGLLIVDKKYFKA